METQQQSTRATGQARASSRPFLGAIVNYTSSGGDALQRGATYAAMITAFTDETVSLHVLAPNAQFDLTGVAFSAVDEVGRWTWPMAG